jgi:hypothetical protein
METAEIVRTPDIVLETDGPMPSVVLLHGATVAGAEWLDDHVFDESQRWAGRVVCETRYLADIVEGARSDGLWVELAANVGRPE